MNFLEHKLKSLFKPFMAQQGLPPDVDWCIFCKRYHAPNTYCDRSF